MSPETDNQNPLTTSSSEQPGMTTPPQQQQPNVQPPVPAPTPMQSPPNKNKTVVIIAIALITIVLGAGLYFLLPKKDNESTASNSNTNTQSDSPQQTEQLKKTSFSNGAVSVAFQHPNDWKVEQVPGELRKLLITSSSGNMLILQANTGSALSAGDCPSPSTVTLEKRLSTGSDNVYFSQFKGFKQLEVEELLVSGEEYGDSVNVLDSSALQKYKNLKEGESLETCSPSIMGSLGRQKDVIDLVIVDKAIDINKQPNIYVSAEGFFKTYDQIKDDTEFIAMLQSLDFKK